MMFKTVFFSFILASVNCFANGDYPIFQGSSLDYVKQQLQGLAKIGEMSSLYFEEGNEGISGLQIEDVVIDPSSVTIKKAPITRSDLLDRVFLYFAKTEVFQVDFNLKFRGESFKASVQFIMWPEGRVVPEEISNQTTTRIVDENGNTRTVQLRHSAKKDLNRPIIISLENGEQLYVKRKAIWLNPSELVEKIVHAGVDQSLVDFMVSRPGSPWKSSSDLVDIIVNQILRTEPVVNINEYSMLASLSERQQALELLKGEPFFMERQYVEIDFNPEAQWEKSEIRPENTSENRFAAAKSARSYDEGGEWIFTRPQKKSGHLSSNNKLQNNYAYLFLLKYGHKLEELKAAMELAYNHNSVDVTNIRFNPYLSALWISGSMTFYLYFQGKPITYTLSAFVLFSGDYEQQYETATGGKRSMFSLENKIRDSLRREVVSKYGEAAVQEILDSEASVPSCAHVLYNSSK